MTGSKRLAVAVHLLALAGIARADHRGFSVAPAPAWVVPMASPASEHPAGDAVRGVTILDSDIQLYKSGSVQQRYVRIVRKIEASSGLEQLSHLSLEFRRAYERLTIHRVSIVRDGRTIDAARAGAIRIIDSEQSLADGMITGSATALIVVKDLRVGDVFDLAYTIEGENPIFRGHLSASLPLGFDVPVGRMRRRVLIGDARPIQIKSHGLAITPTQSLRADSREYVWERRDVPVPAGDDRVPARVDVYPWVEVTDFQSWNEVARWAQALFAVERSPSRALSAQLDEWRKLATPAQRAVAALTFTREAVRYFGVEIGSSSHEPHPPSEVFAQRFGDCKDKALLLVAMLRALGIPASPALTNTVERRGIDDWLPSSAAFDHAIVRLQLDGKTRWVDPTRSFQRGRLEELPEVAYERALVIDEGTTALSEIPRPVLSAPNKVVEEQVRATAGGEARYDVVTRYRGYEAEDFRSVLGSQGREKLANNYLNYYVERYPRIESLGPITVEDSGGDSIVVSEHYRLPSFWEDGWHHIYADAVGNELHKPQVTRRTLPLAQTYPLFTEQRFRIEVADALVPQVDAKTIEDGTLRFRREWKHTDHGFEVLFQLQTLRDAVMPAEIERHLSSLDEIDRTSAFWVQHAEPAGAKPHDAGDALAAGLFVGVLLLVAGLAIAIPRLRRRLLRRRLRKRVELAAGEGPATAIEVADRAALEAAVAARRCACPKRPDDAPWTGEEVRFQDRTLTVVQLLCPTCGARRRLYFAVRATADRSDRAAGVRR